MRNVQTQAQTRASVGPYAAYKDGLIVLTGRCGGGGGAGWRRVDAVAATTVNSHSTSPPSRAGHIQGLCSSGESLPPAVGEMKCHLLSLYSDVWFGLKDPIYL